MIMRRVATAMLVLLVTGSAGRDFKPQGSVRVRVVSGTRTSTRRVRASRGGRFTVTFQGFAFPSCEADGYGGLYALLETLPDGAMKVA